MRKMPDDTGWYWTRDDNGEWAMAYVDVERETVIVLMEHYPGAYRDRIALKSDSFPLGLDCGIVAWYGPIVCPGGDIGGHTIICDEELEQKAADEGKVIGIQFFDFRHCPDEKSGGSITASGLYTREEAGKRLRREVDDECKNT